MLYSTNPTPLCVVPTKSTLPAATLLYGKPREYAGELYSDEHGRKFTTARAGFQAVKDPADKEKLILAIGRKPIAERFRERFEKLRQTIYPLSIISSIANGCLSQ